MNVAQSQGRRSILVITDKLQYLRGWLGFEETGQRLKVTDFCEKVHKKILLTMTVNSTLQEELQVNTSHLSLKALGVC